MNKVREGTNQYCGPAVLSIITGRSVDECASLFAREMGVSDVKSVTYAAFFRILTRLRYSFTDIDSDLSLYSCMVQVSSKPGFYIVGLPKHVAAIEVTSEHEVFFCDNHTKEPIKGSSSARMMQRVDKLIRVQLKPEPKLVSTTIKVQNKGYLYFTVRRENRYEDPNDNADSVLGTVSAGSNEELLEIIKGLSMYADEFK